MLETVTDLGIKVDRRTSMTSERKEEDKVVRGRYVGVQPKRPRQEGGVMESNNKEGSYHNHYCESKSDKYMISL